MSVMDTAVPEVIADLEEFDVFYEREFHQVVALAFALCGSWPNAEDLAQEAFVSAQRRWGKIGTYDEPGAWVRRAVANRSVSLIRRRMSEARAMFRVSRERPVEPTELEEADSDFWRAVRELPPRQRQVIAMYYVNDQTVREVAATLQLSEATVKTHLQRGRKSLESKLSDSLERS